MDINFHYFAVKRIAAVAGFEDGEAQLIAEYSQFVDEYTDNKKYLFRRGQIPEYAEILLDEEGYFQAIQTGFVTDSDYAALVFRENQINYLIPFHFPPRVAIGSREKVSESYKVCRAVRGDHSIISDMLQEEAAACRRYAVGQPKRRQSLVGLGVLLHVFADSYAHEKFNGFTGKVNSASLLEAYTSQGRKVTAEMGPKPWLPEIGHGKVGVAPDVTNVRFKVQQHGVEEWERYNWRDFMDCAMEILKFLTNAYDGTEPTDLQIENMREALEEGFAIEPQDYQNPSPDELAKYWEDTETAVPYIQFSYRKEDVLRRMTPVPDNLEELGISEDEYYRTVWNNEDSESEEKLLSKTYRVDEDFFMFNCAAYSIRKMITMILPE